MVQLLVLKRRNLIKSLTKGSFGILAMGGLSDGNFKGDKQINNSTSAKNPGCQHSGMIMPDYIPYHEDPASSMKGHATRLDIIKHCCKW